MEVLLNRLRGTGDIFTITTTGTMLYAVYLGLLVGCLSTYYYGMLVIVLFLIGECFAWGKCVSWLTDWKKQAVKDYDNDK